MTDDTTTPTAAPIKEAPLPTPDPMFSAEEVARIIDFHGTPVAAQVLREVLGVLGRTAAWAARKQPKNRPEFLREWNPPHLRQLAALCEAYAPEVGSVSAPRDPDLFPDGTSPATDPEAVRAEIASHRAQVMRERAAAGNGHALQEGVNAAAGLPGELAGQIIAEQLGAVPLTQNEIDDALWAEHPAAAPMFYTPDPAPEDPPLFHLADPIEETENPGK